MRGPFTALQVLMLLLATANILWGLWAALFFSLFLTAGAGGAGFPGLNAQDYKLYLIWYGAWVVFAWLSVIGNFVGGVAVGKGKWRGFALTMALFNLIPGPSLLWFTGIPVGIVGLVVVLSKRNAPIFRRVARGADFETALEDAQRDRADGYDAQRANTSDEWTRRHRDDPPRESW